MVELIASGQVPTIYPNSGSGQQSNVGECLTEMTPVLRRDFDEVVVNAVINPEIGVILPTRMRLCSRLAANEDGAAWILSVAARWSCLSA
jgi:hypothetical protein